MSAQALPITDGPALINAGKRPLLVARSDLELEDSAMVHAAKRGANTHRITRTSRDNEIFQANFARSDTEESKDVAIVQRDLLEQRTTGVLSISENVSKGLPSFSDEAQVLKQMETDSPLLQRLNEAVPEPLEVEPANKLAREALQSKSVDRSTG